MELTIYNQTGELKLTVSPNTSSTVTEEVMGECAVSVGFTHTEFVMLDVNDYIDIEGIRYRIMSQYRPKQKNTQTYEYSVKFYAPIHQAENTLMLFTPDNEMTSEFSYDGGPREHLQLWIDNMNRIAGVNVWKIGTVITAENKVIEYKNVKCWDAAFGSNGIAAAFNTEMWADGYYINLCKAERGERVDLGYLQGLTSLQQEENGEVRFFTRLFPLGSTRNIDASKYGHARLQLPGGVQFVDKNVDIYGVKEEFEEEAFSEIYPKYIGTVQSVRTENLTNTEGRDYTVYYIKDAAIPFNPNDYEIAEYTKMIAFQTGELAGRGDDKGSFQANWHEDTKEWEIINTYPDEDTQIPGGLIVPKAGDTYIPWNFRMPDEYIEAAEQEYLAAVNDYLNEYSFDTNKYSGQTDRNHIENNNIKLMIGLNVRLQSDTYFAAGYKDTRITKVVRQLNDLYQATVTCTDKIGDGWKKLVDNSINNIKYALSKQEELSIDVIKTTDSKTPSDNNVYSALMTLKTFLRKDKSDQTNFLLKFGEFIDSMITGKGTGIFPDGRIQTDRIEVRGSMSVMELIINEISAMMGDFSFSDCGHIEKVEFVSDSTYKLWIRKDTEFDSTTLDENDILYSIVNNLKTGGSDYYTSWMRVLTKNVNDNTLTIVLYPDGEVPGGKNYPPVAGYNLTRRGNSILPDEGQINERAQSWLLSSREGRIMFLANVYKPILEDYNYAISIGKFPQIEAIANLPISETDMGIMAKTIVCEQLYRYDYNGDIMSNKVDRGEWSLAIAQSEQPYRFIQHDRLYPDGQHTYTELEQHTVYHYGCKWGCLIDKTQDEPVWNSPSWSLLEGDKNYHLDFESSNGWQFFIQQVNTDIKAVVSYGNRDITNTLMATTGVEVEWLRDTGNIPSDNSWKPTYVDGQKHVIHLSVADMGSGWGSEYRKISFICRVFIPAGEGYDTVENSINIKI